jgi:hypothetical protein
MSKFSFPQRKDPATEPPVDPAALAAFAAGAKDRPGEQKPWDRHDPSDSPRYNVSVRLNDYQLAMLRYVAEAQETSQQKILRKHLLPAIEQLAETIHAERQVKST